MQLKEEEEGRQDEEDAHPKKRKGWRRDKRKKNHATEKVNVRKRDIMQHKHVTTEINRPNIVRSGFDGQDGRRRGGDTEPLSLRAAQARGTTGHTGSTVTRGAKMAPADYFHISLCESRIHFETKQDEFWSMSHPGGIRMLNVRGADAATTRLGCSETRTGAQKANGCILL